MAQRRFYRVDPRFTAQMSRVGMVVFGALLLWALVMQVWTPAIIAASWLATATWASWAYGPAGEPPLIAIDTRVMTIDDRIALGKRVFALGDVASIHIVGPTSDRRIRVHRRTGEHTDVIRALGKKRAAEAVVFLRESLPSAISVIEEEPPGLMSTIRGDF